MTLDGQTSRLIPALATAWCQFGWQYDAIAISKNEDSNRWPTGPTSASSPSTC